jgi:outer membrane protein OmpA-like peptidoglycan-associated protein
MRSVVFTAQIGAGIEIPLRSPNHATQMNLSPFVSFQPYYGQDPRSNESWNVTTVRAGVALKWGSGDIIPSAEAARIAVTERDVEFSIRAPKTIPVQRKVRETFPLRNYVFFDEGSTEVPARYVALTKDQAAKFKEGQLQEVEPMNMTGRSQRQLALYHNILNILGDRLKSNPGASVTLTGASEKGPAEGQAFAESIKKYLTTVFGVDGSRISTEGRDKPRVPSEQPGGVRELTLLREEDRRVDIESKSPELLMQVGGPYDALKPAQIIVVQEDPLDSHVIFHVAGAREALASWSLEVRSERGTVQRFGPFTRDMESIPGRSILGDRAQGDYSVVMVGQTKTGHSVRKEGNVRLVRQEEPKTEEALRFSILFEFNTSKTVATYSAFLTEMVAPLIPVGGKVIIHGHTDIIGDDEYNMTLSNQRAAEARDILHQAISKAGKTGVTIESYGFGEDFRFAPFDNNLPEERCYNRGVIIDIVPAK